MLNNIIEEKNECIKLKRDLEYKKKRKKYKKERKKERIKYKKERKKEEIERKKEQKKDKISYKNRNDELLKMHQIALENRNTNSSRYYK